MNRVIDARQRSAALNHERSFAVTAPAGSGKTELLTRRMLTLLAHVEQPEEILAITFTRKAAGEMRHRILNALMAGQAESPDEPHKRELWQLAQPVLQRDQQLGWCLLENPNRLKLQTIDSFCMSLVRQLPIMSGLGSEAKIAERPDQLYQEAVENLLLQFRQEGDEHGDLAELLRHLDNNSTRIEALLCSLLAKREQWLRHLVGNRTDPAAFRSYLESCLRCLIEETLQLIRSRLIGWERQLTATLNFSIKNLHPEQPVAAELPGCEAEDLSGWQRIAELLLTKGGSWRSRLTKKEGFPSSTKTSEKEYYSQAKQDALALIAELSEQDEMLKLLHEVAALPSPCYEEKQWRLLGRLSNLLPLLVAELMLIFREQGVVDYQQVTMAALEALGHNEAPSDIALLLDYRLRHILVDEFQDTASAQFALLAGLTEGWQPGDGRTFFIVGDGMQSCYGFRDANVGLFLAARQYGIGNSRTEPLDLKVNFRSQPGIVNWVNRTFVQAFPPHDDIARGAVKYTDSSAYSDLPDNSAVQFYACCEDPQRQSEAQRVVELVQQARLDAPGDSIAILVRNRSHLQEITPLLRNVGIPWVGVEIEPLAKRAVIGDLLSLTKAVLNAADRVAWLALLRSPCCGLNLADLERIGFSGTQSSVWEALNAEEATRTLSYEAKQLVSRLVSVLGTALTQRSRKPLRLWLEGIWVALGGPTAHPDSDPRHLSSYFELVEQHETGGVIPDMVGFEEAVENIYAEPTEADNAVQVMTIHKAKGLEFDRVIVPGLDRTSRPQGNELLLWHERLSLAGEAQLLISPISAKGREEDPLYRYLKREQTAKNRLENTRLVYVAATRAIKALSLIACVKRDPESKSLEPPAADSLLSSIWSEVEREAVILEPGDPEIQPQAAGEERADFRLTRIRPDWCLPSLPRGDLLAEFRGHEYSNTVAESSEVSSQERRDETLKKVLQSVAELGVEYWDDVKLRQLPGIVRRLSLTQLLSGAELQSVTATVTAVLQDEKARWLLSGDHEDFHADWPLTLNRNNRLYQLNVPLSFISGGERWLVNFDMTPEPCAGEIISAEQREQLERYAQAASHLEALPIKMAVYFPFLRRLEQHPG